ncbi:MAG: SufD family Fe-S cluster assembly protein [Candidatus Anstonellaceae archaeon]
MKISSKITGGAKILPYSEAAKLPEFAKLLSALPTGKEPKEYLQFLSNEKKEGNVIFVEAGAKAEISIEISGKPTQGFATFFVFGKDSESSVFLKTSYEVDSDEGRALFLSKGAVVQCCFAQKNSESAKSSAWMVARLGEGAQLKFLNSNMGSAEKREKVVFLQEGRGSRCEHYEVSLAKGKQRFYKDSDHRHIAPDTYSRSIFKYATAGNSFVDVEGKVTIEQSAPGSDTHLLAKSLLLSEKSVSKVIPMLFVHNAEVAAGHGSAMTPLQDEELFYLRSRGVGESESRLLVLQGFLQDLLNKSDISPAIIENLKTELEADALKIFPRD